MKKVTLSIIILVSILSISCKNKETKRVEETKVGIRNILGKTLNTPNLEIYNPFDKNVTYQDMNTSEYKIYSSINASCGTCISRINLWSNIVDDFALIKVPIILVLNSDDNFELFKYLCEKKDIKSFKYPFFFDKYKDFINKNKFMKSNKMFETVLVDKNNKIIALGNPAISKTIKDLYIKEIKKHTK